MLQQAKEQNISPRCSNRLGRLLPKAKPRAIACQVGICAEGENDLQYLIKLEITVLFSNNVVAM